jgi:hypothetical protein
MHGYCAVLVRFRGRSAEFWAALRRVDDAVNCQTRREVLLKFQTGTAYY